VVSVVNGEIFDAVENVPGLSRSGYCSGRLHGRCSLHGFLTGFDPSLNFTPKWTVKTVER
jgi:hypothetical protein